MIEGTINYEDLTEEVEDCVEGRQHVFEAFLSFCRCGALERSGGAPVVLTVWPAERRPTHGDEL